MSIHPVCDIGKTLAHERGLSEPLSYKRDCLACLVSVGLNFTSLDPVKALYWSAVVNGVLAAR